MKEKAYEYLEKRKEDIKEIFGLDLEFELLFDLKGYSTLGQCKMLSPKKFCIRLHVKLLEKYKEIYLHDVLTHEVAHGVQFSLYKNRSKPHGYEWQEIMSKLENKPYKRNSRPTYDTKEFRQKRIYKKFPYECLCKNFTHYLTSITHNRVLKKQRFYTCKRCKSPLIYKGNK